MRRTNFGGTSQIGTIVKLKRVDDMTIDNFSNNLREKNICQPVVKFFTPLKCVKKGVMMKCQRPNSTIYYKIGVDFKSISVPS